MNIDRVAKAMTAATRRRGPSGPAFTARVMAPIEGRPSPGFTARVMKRIDAPAAGRGFGFGRALMLVPAAIALAAGAIVLLRGGAQSPALPAAPVLATNGGPRLLETPPTIPQPRPNSPTRGAQLPAVVPEQHVLPAIYTIAALEGPAEIATTDIEPAACTIPALEGPAPLKVPDLPSNGGGSQKEIKE